MSEKHTDTKNLAVGALIGAAIGIGAMALLRTCHSHPNALQKMGDTLAHLGEAVKDRVEHAEHQMKTNEDKIAHVLEWTAAGIQLWKNLRS